MTDLLHFRLFFIESDASSAQSSDEVSSATNSDESSEDEQTDRKKVTLDTSDTDSTPRADPPSRG